MKKISANLAKIDLFEDALMIRSRLEFAVIIEDDEKSTDFSL
jgi:hypothetical protein